MEHGMSDSRTLNSTCGNQADRRVVDELPVAYVEVNAQGVIVCINQVARQMHDPALGEMAGKTIWDLMPPEEREESRLAFEALMRNGDDPPVIFRSIYTKQGYRVQEIHRSLILSAEGKPLGVRSVTFDVTEMEMARKYAQRSKDWMESILDSMPEAMIVTDALGFVRYLNPAGEELTGWKRENISGMIVEEALPLVSYQSDQEGELNFRMTVDHKWKGTLVVLDRARNELALEMSTSPLLDRNNQFTTGVVGIMRRAGETQASSRKPQAAEQACHPAA
jgi:two-component system, LuxR family, sensor kinase FixL